MTELSLYQNFVPQEVAEVFRTEPPEPTTNMLLRRDPNDPSRWFRQYDYVYSPNVTECLMSTLEHFNALGGSIAIPRSEFYLIHSPKIGWATVYSIIQHIEGVNAADVRNDPAYRPCLARLSLGLSHYVQWLDDTNQPDFLMDIDRLDHCVCKGGEPWLVDMDPILVSREDFPRHEEELRKFARLMVDTYGGEA